MEMQKKSNLTSAAIVLLVFIIVSCGGVFWYIGQQKTRAGEISLYKRFLMQEGKAERNNFLQIQGVAGLMAKNRLIINPGSVGQPRDGDPRASYAIYDTESKLVRLYRVPYDISITQARMAKLKLPARLMARLSDGV